MRVGCGRISLLLWVAACGRIGFDPRAPDGGGDGASDGGIDAAPPPFAQRAYVKASNSGAGDAFGDRIALSGDGQTLAVGAPLEAGAGTGVNANEASDAAPMAGAAYVFVRSGATWVQQAYLKASNAETVDYFGAAVAISDDGSTIAVSSIFEDSNTNVINGNQADNSVSNTGAVYVFTRAGTTWTQQAYLKAATSGNGDQLGTSVTLSGDGNRLAAGAKGEDGASAGLAGNPGDNSAVDAGAVFLFERVGTVWSQMLYIKPSNTQAGDNFGEVLALSRDGATLAISALLEDGAAPGINGNQNDNSAPDAGAVYLYHFDGVSWSQQAYVKASNPDAGDQFGSYIALSDDGATLAVGAKSEASAAPGVGGAEIDNSAPNAGAVYAFERVASTWTQRAYLKAPHPAADDLFGFAVSLSGDGTRLAVGALGDDSPNLDPNDNSAPAAGAVFVFDRTTSWTPVMTVKPAVLDAGDFFGVRVDLSRDGQQLVIGSKNEDSAATGAGGDATSNTAMDSGAVYVFD